jgi:hypothetical protein
MIPFNSNLYLNSLLFSLPSLVPSGVIADGRWGLHSREIQLCALAEGIDPSHLLVLCIAWLRFARACTKDPDTEQVENLFLHYSLTYLTIDCYEY